MAIEFVKASNQFLTVPDNSGCALTGAPWAISWWQRTSAYSLTVARKLQDARYSGWWLMWHSSGALLFEPWNAGSGGGYYFNLSTGQNDGAIHFCTLILDDVYPTGILHFYADGILIQSLPFNAGSIGGNSEPVIIGNENNYGYRFDGLMSDFRIYNHLLSAEAVASLYRDQGGDSFVNDLALRILMSGGADGSAVSSAVDVSSNLLHGVPSNSPVYRAFPLRK